MCIFYNESLVEVLDAFHFWLSETPSIPNSVSWESAYPRMAVVAVSFYKFCFTVELITKKLRTKITGDDFTFYVIATHLDHKSRKARENGAKLIAKYFEETNTEKLPVSYKFHLHQCSYFFDVGRYFYLEILTQPPLHPLTTFLLKMDMVIFGMSVNFPVLIALFPIICAPHSICGLVN